MKLCCLENAKFDKSSVFLQHMEVVTKLANPFSDSSSLALFSRFEFAGEQKSPSIFTACFDEHSGCGESKFNLNLISTFSRDQGEWVNPKKKTLNSQCQNFSLESRATKTTTIIHFVGIRISLQTHRDTKTHTEHLLMFSH